MVIFNSYVKLPEGTSTVEWVNVSQLPSGPTLQMFPLMWCWWKQSDISLHAFHVYFHSSRWDKTLLRVSFAKPGSPEQPLRLLSDGLPGYIIQSPLLDADKSLSYLVGGLEPWNFMTFHSVGNGMSSSQVSSTDPRKLQGIWFIYWLVLWNMFLFSIIYGMSSANHWRTPSFFKMGTLHHQPAIPNGWISIISIPI